MKRDIPFKTLGSRAAYVVAELHERGRTIFRHADIADITLLGPKSVRNFVAALVRRGVATRLRPGLFVLVPFDLGHERDHLGNPYVVAREMVGAADYYLSHASALDLHGMVTQPQLVTYATTTRSMRPRVALGAEFRFVRCQRMDFFGTSWHWVTKTERVRVSDIERTVIDGLKQPQYCGGFTDVAKGFCMRRDDIDTGRLVDYARRLGVGAVIRRLGFLLETFEAGAGGELERLRKNLTASYAILDPSLADEGRFMARWRLQLNVDAGELATVAST